MLLVLVIFFMLSSTFVDEGRMRVQLPVASDKPHDNRSAERIVVTVTQQGGYRVNERELVNSSRETLQRAVADVAGQDRGVARRAARRCARHAPVGGHRDGCAGQHGLLPARRSPPVQQTPGK